MPGMTPVSPEDIGKSAGFPTSPGVTPVQDIPRALLAPTPLAPMKAGPSDGTTEIVPGMTDWLRNLVVSMFPSNAAKAAPVAPPAPVTTIPTPAAIAKSAGFPTTAPAPAVNGAFPPGQAPVQQPAIDLGSFWQRPRPAFTGGIRG